MCSRHTQKIRLNVQTFSHSISVLFHCNKSHYDANPLQGWTWCLILKTAKCSVLLKDGILELSGPPAVLSVRSISISFLCPQCVVAPWTKVLMSISVPHKIVFPSFQTSAVGLVRCIPVTWLGLERGWLQVKVDVKKYWRGDNVDKR